MERIKTPKVKKTLKAGKTLKPTKSSSGPSRVTAPQRVKAASKRVKAPTPKDIKEQGEMIRVLCDVHSADRTEVNSEWKAERYEEVKVVAEPEDIQKFLESCGNFSKKDSLWHYGSTLYNNETHEESKDRIRLFHESIHSYPSKEYLERLGLEMGYNEGWMAGFMIGVAYGRDHIDTETIKQWEKNRAEQLRGKPFGNDIPI